MSNDCLSPEVSQRICKHMNDEHKNTLLAYARFYGGVLKPKDAEMIILTSESMVLLVDGKDLEIHFDHILKDRNDAHQTLVAMMKKLPNDI